MPPRMPALPGADVAGGGGGGGAGGASGTEAVSLALCSPLTELELDDGTDTDMPGEAADDVAAEAEAMPARTASDGAGGGCTLRVPAATSA